MVIGFFVSVCSALSTEGVPMRALVLVLLAELAVIVWLSTLLLGGTPGAAGNSTADGPDPAESHVRGQAAVVVAPLSSPENAHALQPIERHAVEPAHDADADGLLGIVVAGTVRDTGGKPVEGASVYFRRDNEYHGGQSTPNGAYAATNLAPGEWQLTCRADGFGQYEASCTLDTDAFQQIDVELRAAYVVKVKIQTAAGENPLEQWSQANMWAEPCVVATTERLRGNLPITEQSSVWGLGAAEWHSASGRRSGRGDKKLREQGYAGELRMSQDPPVFASLVLRHVLLQSKRIEPGQHELTFVIEPEDVTSVLGVVKLRLIDGVSGQPLSDHRVSLQTAQGGGSYTKTDVEGRAVIENALPGLGMLETAAKERESLWLYVRVPPGGAVDLGEIVMSPIVKIVGKVVDADGKAPPQADVTWTELDSRTWPQPLVTRRGAGVESDGTFSLGVGKHRYVVFASTRNGGFGHATVDATGGAPAQFTIQLAQTTTIAYRTHFDQAVGYAVTVLGADRSPLSVHWLGADYRPSATNLPPGDYTLEIHDAADRLVRTSPLRVGAEPLTIDVP